MRPIAILLLCAFLAAAAASAARADDKTDHDRALRAVERGEMQPLPELLAAVRVKLPGEILRVEIERQKGRWVYEFRVVGADGRLFDVYVDGKSGEIVRTKEK